MKDLSKLTNQQVVEARKYFTNWSKSLSVYNCDVDMPTDEYWYNFCKNHLYCCDNKIPVNWIYSAPIHLAEELANRFEKVLLG